MHTLPEHRRILLLTEGHLGVFSSKTAAAMLRYRAGDIVGIVDGPAAGGDVARHVPWAPMVPIVGDIGAAASLRPDALYVGIAPAGGALPAEMRRHVIDAMGAGLDIVSGLHVFLADDLELARRAAESGSQILDLRRAPDERILATGLAREARCRRVLTVGTDAAVGKMVAAIEMARGAERRGLRARFLATGQTGMMIAGAGVAVDACIADFAPGAIERLVLGAADSDVCLVEGQGSIGHPGFSAVTVALVHGCCPDAMVLVHHAGRTRHKSEPHTPIPPIGQLVAAYEGLARLMHPSAVVGVALNSHGAGAETVAREKERLTADLGLPVVDPLVDGVEPLIDAIFA